MNWTATIPPGADALTWAGTIERNLAPRDWPEALARVPDALRADAEAYLRGIAERLRNARQARTGSHRG